MTDISGRQIETLVLAGGLNDEEMHRLTSEKRRCFIKLGDIPMLEIILKALRQSPRVGAISAVGNAGKLETYKGTLIDNIIPEGETLQENFFKGLEEFRDRDLILVASADLPLISAEIIDNLFTLFAREEAEIYYPIIPLSVIEKKLPGGKRTTQKFREGEFTGGNIFLLSPKAILNNRDKIDRVIEARKNKLELIKLFGLPFIVRYLMQTLDLPSVEEKAEEILGAKVKAIICPHAEVGFDIDKPEDYKLAVDVIRQRDGRG